VGAHAPVEAKEPEPHVEQAEAPATICNPGLHQVKCRMTCISDLHYHSVAGPGKRKEEMEVHAKDSEAIVRGLRLQ
jgi:hypothetical protein